MRRILSSLILHPSSFIPHPSSFIPHPSSFSSAIGRLTVYKSIRDNRRVIEFLPWLNKQMSRLFLLTIATAFTIFAAPIFVKAGAQQKRANYGPVVSAYLMNLVEELNELDYQLNRREITGADYQRSKQRLNILRRYVERHAAQSREDEVPEIQILTQDEFGTIGLRPNHFQLKTGEVLDGQWKLIGVEHARQRFFVLERIEQSEKSTVENTRSKQKSARQENPLDLIETIVIRDRTVQTASPQTNNQQDEPAPHVNPPPSPAVVKSPLESPPQLPAPRITHIYLPQYTDKARAKAVEGELVVRAMFQRDGRVTKVKVERGLGFGLDQRAIDSVKRIGFLPAMTDGQEVDASTLVIFNFRLSKVTFYLLPEQYASTQGGQAGQAGQAERVDRTTARIGALGQSTGCWQLQWMAIFLYPQAWIGICFSAQRPMCRTIRSITHSTGAVGWIGGPAQLVIWARTCLIIRTGPWD